MASGATFNLWDCPVVYVDALTGSGTVIGGALSNSPTLVVGVAGGSGAFSGVFANGSASNIGSLTKTGGGIEALSGVNTYSGSTTITAGMLQMNSAGALPAASSIVASGGTLDLGGNTFTQAATSGISFQGGVVQHGSLVYGGTYNAAAGTVSANLGGAAGLNMTGPGAFLLSGSNSYTGPTAISSGTLEFGGAANQTLSGVISGSGALVMMGPGALTLAGSNSYSGLLTVAAGTLAVGGSLIEGMVNVQNGGVLSGSGAVGIVSLYSGGTLAPGNNGSGAMPTGSVNLNPGAALNYALGTAADGLVTVYGSLSLAGSVVVNVSPGSNWGVGAYPLFNLPSYSFTQSTTFNSNWTIAGGNLGGAPL